MVVEHCLRLDGSVVPHRDGAVSLGVTQGFVGFDDGKHATDAVIGNAGVGSLEPIANADVAKHVVRQRSQQPHGIDRIGQFAAEGLQILIGGGEQRKVVVLAVERATARADVYAGPIAERRRGLAVQPVTVRCEACLFDGAA